MEETKIRWSLGYTVNTGDFEFLRVDCSIEDHIRANEEFAQANERIYKTVEGQLLARVNEARQTFAK